MSFSNTSTGDAPADPYTAKSKDDIPLKEKVSEFTNFASSCKFGMMTTRVGETGQLTSRAMALAATESHGLDLLFHTNTESGKTDSLASDPHINISFLDSSGQWASVSGVATVDTDRSLVHKHYSPALKAWLGDLGDGKHDGGPDDPRIGVIRVKSEHITYGVTGKTLVGRALDVAKGTVTGETPGFLRIRDISKEEAEEVRKGGLA
ncbi:MAG: hypothetical protein LQ340_000504 [Diploschistes diacapsis]|nr:MAG: hypothetical protein LQ340_000504 [Diploschistes diacapsis]